MAQRSGIRARYDLVTLIRDPLERLASHLNWADRYNHGVDRLEYLRLSREEKALVAEIKATDAQDFGALRGLFRLDSLTKAKWFFNPQFAVLFVNNPGNILHYTGLDERGPHEISARIAEFETCCSLSQMHAGLAARGCALPDLPVRNAAPTKRFQPSPLLAQAAHAYLALDERLFRQIKAQSPDLDRLARLLGSDATEI